MSKGRAGASALALPYYWAWCWLGRPRCYRDYSDSEHGDWWYAMCKYCHRQAESVVHEDRWLSEKW